MLSNEKLVQPQMHKQRIPKVDTFERFLRISAQLFHFWYIFGLLRTGQVWLLESLQVQQDFVFRNAKNLRKLSNDYVKSWPKIKQRLSNDYQNLGKWQLVEI